jgi:hypothetical protein
VEAHAQRPAEIGGVLARPPRRPRAAAPGRPELAHALGQHEAADNREQGHVRDHDDELELARPPHGGEKPDAEHRADEAAEREDDAELEVEGVAAERVEGARGGGGGDLGRLRGDRDGRRDAQEDEERRHQKAAADPEQAGDEADRRAHPENHEHADRHLGDGQVDLQEAVRSVRRWRRREKSDQAP